MKKLKHQVDRPPQTSPPWTRKSILLVAGRLFRKDLRGNTQLWKKYEWIETDQVEWGMGFLRSIKPHAAVIDLDCSLFEVRYVVDEIKKIQLKNPFRVVFILPPGDSLRHSLIKDIGNHEALFKPLNPDELLRILGKAFTSHLPPPEGFMPSISNVPFQ